MFKAAPEPELGRSARPINPVAARAPRSLPASSHRPEGSMASSFAARAGAWLVVFVRARALFLCRRPPTAFCGFFVGKADAIAVQRSLAGHHGAPRAKDRHQHGERLPRRRSTEFALVVPGAAVLQRSQINVGDREDSSSASTRTARRGSPSTSIRDPCARREDELAMRARRRRGAPRSRPQQGAPRQGARRRPSRRSYTVGEYDIVILSAKQSRRARDLAARERLPDPARRQRAR